MAVVIKRNNNLSANLNINIRWKLNYFVENIEEVKINSTSNESNGKFVTFCTFFSLMLKIKNPAIVNGPGRPPEKSQREKSLPEKILKTSKKRKSPHIHQHEDIKRFKT